MTFGRAGWLIYSTKLINENFSTKNMCYDKKKIEKLFIDQFSSFYKKKDSLKY